MKKIELPPRAVETLFGVHDQNIKYLESLLDVRVDARGQDLSIDGDPQDVTTAERIVEDFAALFREGKTFTDRELRAADGTVGDPRGADAGRAAAYLDVWVDWLAAVVGRAASWNQTKGR